MKERYPRRVGLLLRNKKGDLHWDLLVIILLALAVLVAMLIFSTFMREKIIEAFQVFVEKVFGD